MEELSHDAFRALRLCMRMHAIGAVDHMPMLRQEAASEVLQGLRHCGRCDSMAHNSIEHPSSSPCQCIEHPRHVHAACATRPFTLHENLSMCAAVGTYCKTYVHGLWSHGMCKREQ